ncbi:MAG: hypothetical protein ACRDOE_19405, partial [Streptosporangiaceae bacterium]
MAGLDFSFGGDSGGNPYLELAEIGRIFFWDLINALESLFQGRARDEATAQVIFALRSSPNFAAQLASVELHRLLFDDNIVISDSSGHGQMLLGQIAHHFVLNMEAQGHNRKQAFDAWVTSLSRAVQAGGPLPAILRHKVPDGFHLTGGDTAELLYCANYQWLIQKKHDTHDAARDAFAWTLRHLDFKDLIALTIQPNGNPTPPCPRPPLSIPRTRGICAPGYEYERATKACVFDAAQWPTQQPNPPPTQPCPHGFIWDPVAKRCVPLPSQLPNPQPTQPPPCPPGMVWDPQTGQCVPILPTPQCPPGMVWDPQTGQCVPILPTPQCPPG